MGRGTTFSAISLLGSELISKPKAKIVLGIDEQHIRKWRL
jgi:hypothetical protein